MTSWGRKRGDESRAETMTRRTGEVRSDSFPNKRDTQGLVCFHSVYVRGTDSTLAKVIPILIKNKVIPILSFYKGVNQNSKNKFNITSNKKVKSTSFSMLSHFTCLAFRVCFVHKYSFSGQKRERRHIYIHANRSHIHIRIVYSKF